MDGRVGMAILGGLFCLLTTHGAEGQLANTAWPAYQHDSRHTGLSPYAGPVEPAVRWTFAPESTVSSPPSIGTDGILYVGVSDGVMAVRPNGTQHWHFNVSAEATGQPAVAADGTVYALIGDGYLYSLTPGGTMNWRILVGDYIPGSSPMIGPDGTIYVAGARGGWGVTYYVFAIDSNGTEEWNYEVGAGYRGGANTAPAIGPNGTIYADYTYGCDVWGDLWRVLVALRNDGTSPWSYIFSTGEDTFGLAVASDDTVYVSASGGLYAFDSAGKNVWTFPHGGAGAPSIDPHGTVYYYSGDHYVYAVNPDGTEKWKIYTGNPSPWAQEVPAIGCDGVLYVQGAGSELWAVNPDGTQKWVLPDAAVSAHGPVIGADGTIYLASDGRLLAVNTPSPDRMLRVNIYPAVEIQWNSAAGVEYQVQWSTDIASGMWYDLGSSVSGTVNSLSVFDSTRNAQRRFYRVKVLP